MVSSAVGWHHGKWESVLPWCFMNFLIKCYSEHWSEMEPLSQSFTHKSRETEVVGYSGSGGLFIPCLLPRLLNLGHPPRVQERHCRQASSQFYPQSCKYLVYSACQFGGTSYWKNLKTKATSFSTIFYSVTYWGMVAQDRGWKSQMLWASEKEKFFS